MESAWHKQTVCILFTSLSIYSAEALQKEPAVHSQGQWMKRTVSSYHVWPYRPWFIHHDQCSPPRLPHSTRWHHIIPRLHPNSACRKHDASEKLVGSWISIIHSDNPRKRMQTVVLYTVGLSGHGVRVWHAIAQDWHVYIGTNDSTALEFGGAPFTRTICPRKLNSTQITQWIHLLAVDTANSCLWSLSI